MEGHHFGDLPDVRDAENVRWCACEGLKTCSRCCFGFPMENGVWMNDWDADLNDAAAAAWKVAKTPLISSILEISSKHQTLPFAMSDEAAARLLDIAILCGNSQAAVNLAKTCSVRPLRRWSADELWLQAYVQMVPDRSDRRSVFSAALLAGVDFQDLHVSVADVGVPLLLSWALCFDSENWQQLGHFFKSKPWWPSCEIELGGWFLSRGSREDGEFYCWISPQKVQNALKSGWDLKYIRRKLCRWHLGYYAGLLDLAILCGDSGSAEALATAGVELHEDCLELLKRCCCGETVVVFDFIDSNVQDDDRFHVGSALECQSAASAAARASFRRSFKREGVEKGVALLQVMAKFNAADIPLDLVHDILALSMEAPKILDQLDLWDEVRGWMPFLEVKADRDDDTFQKDVQVEEEAAVEEPGRLGLCPAVVCNFAMF